MQSQATSPYQQFRVLKLIYTALATAIALFAIAVLTISYVQEMTFSSGTDEDNDLFLYISLALVVLSIPMSKVLFHQLIGKVKGTSEPLSKKLSTYQTALIVKAAILEFPAAFVCVTALITDNLLILLLIPLILFIFFINKPSLFRLESDLELSRDEVDQLKD